MQNFTYDSVMNMPTNERRFYLARHHRRMSEQEEKMEDMKKNSKSNNYKGSRTTKVSGQALKNQINNGKLPI